MFSRTVYLIAPSLFLDAIEICLYVRPYPDQARAYLDVRLLKGRLGMWILDSFCVLVPYLSWFAAQRFGLRAFGIERQRSKACDAQSTWQSSPF